MKTIKAMVLAMLLVPVVSFMSNGQVVNGSFEDEFGNFSVDGWQNNGGIASSDTPPNGGNYSLALFGGCIWTSCSQEITQIQPGEIWALRCWAKADNALSGGTISFSDGYNGVFVTDSNWAQYIVVDTFDIPNFDTISIRLEGGGGFAGEGGIMVDLVELEKLGNVIISVDDIDKDQWKVHSFQNYPNPFSTETKISYEIDFPAIVSLKIVDVLSQETSLLVNDFHPIGKYEYQWLSSGNILPGIYFCELKAVGITDPSKKAFKTIKIVKQAE